MPARRSAVPTGRQEAKEGQSVDPLAAKYPGWSPYNYCLGNPMNAIDPNGKDVFVKDGMKEYVNFAYRGSSTFRAIYNMLRSNREIVATISNNQPDQYTIRANSFGDTYSYGNGYGTLQATVRVLVDAVHKTIGARIGHEILHVFEQKYAFDELKDKNAKYGKIIEYLINEKILTEDGKHCTLNAKAIQKLIFDELGETDDDLLLDENIDVTNQSFLDDKNKPEEGTKNKTIIFDQNEGKWGWLINNPLYSN